MDAAIQILTKTLTIAKTLTKTQKCVVTNISNHKSDKQPGINPQILDNTSTAIGAYKWDSSGSYGHFF